MSVFASTVESVPSAAVSRSEVAKIWIDLRDSGRLLVNEQGLFYVEENEYSNSVAYVQFLQVVEQCNIAISEGVLEATESNSVQIADGAILNYEQTLEDLNEYYALPPRADTHTIE